VVVEAKTIGVVKSAREGPDPITSEFAENIKSSIVDSEALKQIRILSARFWPPQ